MASPQTENGYTRISNELLEALCFVDMPDSARKVFLCLIRKTYGFHKTEDRIATSQIEAMTNLHKRRVQEALAWLKKQKIIMRNPKNWKTGINKDYEKWKPLSTGRGGADFRRVRISALGGADFRRGGMRISAPTKETLQKKFIQKKGEAVENKKTEGKKPYIEGDRAYQDPTTKKWRVQIHTGEWVDYVGDQKPEWR